MNAEQRQNIVKKVAKLIERDYNDVLCSFLMDELNYSEVNIITDNGGEEEVQKICQAYGITEDKLPKDILPFVERIRSWPPIGGWDHYDLNDYVSYIGEYYDGEPTTKYRKKGRYPIDQIR